MCWTSGIQILTLSTWFYNSKISVQWVHILQMLPLRVCTAYWPRCSSAVDINLLIVGKANHCTGNISLCQSKKYFPLSFVHSPYSKIFQINTVYPDKIYILCANFCMMSHFGEEMLKFKLRIMFGLELTATKQN
jgi:hypothetical protein